MFWKIIISALIMISLDAVYLGLVMKTPFETLIQKIQGSSLSLRVLPVVLCYFLLVGGLYYFILRENRSWKEAALLGLIIYGVYETTNLALLKNWNWTLAIIDVFWGAVLFSLTTGLTYRVL